VVQRQVEAHEDALLRFNIRGDVKKEPKDPAFSLLVPIEAHVSPYHPGYRSQRDVCAPFRELQQHLTRQGVGQAGGVQLFRELRVHSIDAFSLAPSADEGHGLPEAELYLLGEAREASPRCDLVGKTSRDPAPSRPVTLFASTR
jgi:hypothetical protein